MNFAIPIIYSIVPTYSEERRLILMENEEEVIQNEEYEPIVKVSTSTLGIDWNLCIPKVGR